MSKKKNKVNDGGSPEKTKEAAIVENPKEKSGGKSNQKPEEGQKKEASGDDGGGNAVVLNMDLHCEGCAHKVVKFVRGFQGVEKVKVDSSSGKVTVGGKVNPVELRAKLEEKTHKKVELLSPVPKKEKDNAGDGKEDKKKGPKVNTTTPKDGIDQKNPKEPSVTTAVLKVSLHCEGCIKKIHKIVSKTKGFQEMQVDRQKDLVTVKGALDMKDLAANLQKHLKKDVQIVPPKKDDKKEKEGGGRGGGEGGGEAKPKAGNNSGAAAGGGGRGGDGGEKVEGNKIQVQYGQFGYGESMAPYGYASSSSPYMHQGPPANIGQGDPYQFHYQAPQIFSDENPNACIVM